MPTDNPWTTSKNNNPTGIPLRPDLQHGQEGRRAPRSKFSFRKFISHCSNKQSSKHPDRRCRQPQDVVNKIAAAILRPPGEPAKLAVGFAHILHDSVQAVSDPDFAKDCSPVLLMRSGQLREYLVESGIVTRFRKDIRD